MLYIALYRHMKWFYKGRVETLDAKYSSISTVRHMKWFYKGRVETLDALFQLLDI